MKYWAFISYSHRDESWARWLHRAIEGYRVPGRLVGRLTHDGVVPKRLFPLFRDRDELASSSDLSSSIVESLKQSRHLIVICSPEAAASRWVNEEVKAFKALGRQDRVLCLVVRGDPDPGDPRQECFPPAVLYRVDGEGTIGSERAEPLAADARSGKDGRSDAKLKLLSALLGVGLDELKLRERARQRAGRWLSFLFVAVFGGMLLLPSGPIQPLRSFVFDAYQTLMPRRVASMPTTIVEIDERSLIALGQWPWPRTELARLVTTVNRAQPAAIGINILMPEADALSPERVLAKIAVQDSSVAAALRSLKSNDAVLATALASAPTVLIFAGENDASSALVRSAPIIVRAPSTEDYARSLAYFRGALTSIDELNGQASGWGFASVSPTRGIVRRVPLMANVNGVVVPSLGIEMLRVAYHAPSIDLMTSGQSVTGVTVGDTHVRTEEDGNVRVYYSQHRADRFVSAVDVLEGKIDPAALQSKLILISPTATGLVDLVNTPIGDRMPGAEVWAQLLENLFDGSLLDRPSWAPLGEAAAFCLLAVWLVLGVPRWSATRSLLTLLVSCVTVAIAGVLGFAWGRLLLDPIHVTLGLVVLFGLVMSYGFFANSARSPDPSPLES